MLKTEKKEKPMIAGITLGKETAIFYFGANDYMEVIRTETGISVRSMDKNMLVQPKGDNKILIHFDKR